MNFISKVLLFIFKNLSAVVNPEFMQVGRFSMNASPTAYIGYNLTFPKSFRNTPMVFPVVHGAFAFFVKTSIETKTSATITSYGYGTGTYVGEVNWIAIDLTQPVLKIGGGLKSLAITGLQRSVGARLGVSI